MRQLNSGLITDSKTPDPLSSLFDNLTAFIDVQPLDVTCTGTIAQCQCAEPLLRGTSAWFKVWESLAGNSPIRISIHDSEPLPTDPGTFTGSSLSCIGTSIFSSFYEDSILEVPIFRNSSHSRVWISVSIDGIATEDKELTTIGFSPVGGINMRDAHVSLIPLPVPSQSSGWVAFGNTDNITFSNLDISEEIIDKRKYVLSEDGSATISGTSYGPWLTWNSSEAASLTADAVLSAGSKFVLASDGGQLYYAGDRTGLDMSTIPPLDTLIDIAAMNDGFIGVTTSGSAIIFGTSNSSRHGADVATWNNISRVRVTGTTASLICGITNTGSIVSSGWQEGVQDVFAILDPVDDLVLSVNLIGFLFSDKSTRVFGKQVSGKLNPEITSAVFADIASIAVTYGAFIALTSDGLFKTYNYMSPSTLPMLAVPPSMIARSIISSPISATTSARIAVYYDQML